MVFFAWEGFKMKQNKVRRETAEERRKRVRNDWWAKLWLFRVSSCSAHDIVVETYLVARQYDAVHWVRLPNTIRIPTRAECNNTLFDAAALFFDRHRKARYIVITLTKYKKTEKGLERAKVTDWLE